MSKTVIIGLTGPTGSGKTAARDVFEEYGCRFVDCDALSRQAVEPGAPALALLAEHFGGDIIRGDGSLDRGLLAQRAFPTPEGRQRLNSIVHPAVIDLLEGIIDECQQTDVPGVVVDAPLLYEAGLDKRCDAVIAVIAPEELRLERIMRRDNMTEEAARLRMAAQHDSEFYAAGADHVIINDGTVEEMRRRTAQTLDRIFAGGGRP